MIAGVVLAAAIVQAVSVAVGAAVGAVLPTTTVAVVSGVAFLAVATWTLRGNDDEDDEEIAARANARRRAGIGLVVMVAGT